MKIVKDLEDFIDAAEKSRKYPRNTAAAKRSALRMFGTELNDDEAQSLEAIESNFDSIYQEVFNKNKADMSASSLLTYKRRVSGLLKDYKKYGLDPTKMANWSRPVRKTTRKTETSENTPPSAKEPQVSEQTRVSRFELPLRDGVIVSISVPRDITKKEVQKIRKYIDFLESISKDSSNEV